MINTTPHFDRMDIVRAYYLIEVHYHRNGWLQERPSNRRRMESTYTQLYRMGFRAPIGTTDNETDLTPNALAIYRQLEQSLLRLFSEQHPAREKQPT